MLINELKMMHIKNLIIALSSTSLLLGGLIFEKSYSAEVNCNSPVWKDQKVCDKSKGVAAIDEETGLDVIEFVRDIDWKTAGKTKIPWSKIVKVRSVLDGTYELAVYDRDYKGAGSSTRQTVRTKWTTDTLQGSLQVEWGCGFLSCAAVLTLLYL